MIILNKKSLSKKRLDLQEKENSNSGVEMLDDKVTRLYAEYSPTLIKSLSEIGFPNKGEQIRIITTKSFNAMAYVDFILMKEKILETYIAIYSIDYATGSLLNDLAKTGKLGKVTFLISNLKNSAHRKKDVVVREKFLKNENIKLVFCGSHAKVILVKTEKNYYVIEGSSNLAPNSRIEQMLFENSEQMYKFHKSWIDEVDTIATERELAIYDYNGTKIKGKNEFKK